MENTETMFLQALQRGIATTDLKTTTLQYWLGHRMHCDRRMHRQYRDYHIWWQGVFNDSARNHVPGIAVGCWKAQLEDTLKNHRDKTSAEVDRRTAQVSRGSPKGVPPPLFSASFWRHSVGVNEEFCLHLIKGPGGTSLTGNPLLRAD